MVLKFGGRSLGDPGRVVDYVERSRAGGTPTVVVVSARRGVTDLLRAALRPGPPVRADRIVARLVARHPGLPPEGRRLVDRAGRLAQELHRRPGVARVEADRLLSQGERISAHWFTQRLRERGIPAVAVEADHLGLITDNVYGASRILLERSARPVRTRLGRLLRTGRVPVVTGFFGRSLEGRVATLGRGGSDYSAAALGALVGATRVELIKRDVALFTADPHLVRAARHIPRLSYEEAAEFAQFGARVLHPITIEPVRWAQVELRVQSLENPALLTTIGPARARSGFRSVTCLAPLSDLSVRVAGGRQRTGILADITRRLAEARINLVAVVTTESVLGLLLEPADTARARRILAPLADYAGAVVSGPEPVALVSVVGAGILSEVPRVPRRILSEARGLLASRHSLSIVVPESRGLPTLRALHRVYVEDGGPREARAPPRAIGRTVGANRARLIYPAPPAGPARRGRRDPKGTRPGRGWRAMS